VERQDLAEAPPLPEQAVMDMIEVAAQRDTPRRRRRAMVVAAPRWARPASGCRPKSPERVRTTAESAPAAAEAEQVAARITQKRAGGGD
jgi:hypothetical protein